jgi:hypothetical protein
MSLREPLGSWQSTLVTLYHHSGRSSRRYAPQDDAQGFIFFWVVPLRSGERFILPALLKLAKLLKLPIVKPHNFLPQCPSEWLWKTIFSKKIFSRAYLYEFLVSLHLERLW